MLSKWARISFKNLVATLSVTSISTCFAGFAMGSMFLHALVIFHRTPNNVLAKSRKIGLQLEAEFWSKNYPIRKQRARGRVAHRPRGCDHLSAASRLIP